MAGTITNNVNEISTGKPKIGGAIFTAPVGTALPTDATTELNTAFKGLGYVSDDGLENDNAPDTDTISAWGGEKVLTITKSKDDTFKFTLIQTLNVEVAKVAYGSNNVSGDLTTGITIKANSNSAESRSYVIDMVLNNDCMKRIVIPDATVSDLGTITYKDDEAIGYEITLSCTPDSAGNTHYEYIIKKGD